MRDFFNLEEDGTVDIFVKTAYITCPSCGEDIEGFLSGDPRGQEVECDHCEMDISIPQDSQLVFA